MPNQPSKKSLSRAAKLVDWWLSYPDGGDDPEFRTLRDRLALEFDAIAEEHNEVVNGADYFNAEREVEYRALLQKNALLIEALQLAENFLPIGGESCLYCDNDDEKHSDKCPMTKINAVLASYVPAKTETKKT